MLRVTRILITVLEKKEGMKCRVQSAELTNGSKDVVDRLGSGFVKRHEA